MPRTLHICCCLELLSKSSRSRVPRSYLGTLAEGFRQVVSTVLPKSSEQDAQVRAVPAQCALSLN
jgi:hypothetical protein